MFAVSNIINYGVRASPGDDSDAAWRIVIGLGIGFSLPLGFGVLFTPESPRWLAGKGRWEDARMSMARLRGLVHDPNHELVNSDFKEMEDSINEQKSAGQGTWAECFTGQPSGIPRLAYRTFIGCAIQFFQQWTGVNYFFYVSCFGSRPNMPAANCHSMERPSSNPQALMILSKFNSFLVLSM
jgi:SP family sugar:H+ symporter-like MFS transporter